MTRSLLSWTFSVYPADVLLIASDTLRCRSVANSPADVVWWEVAGTIALVISAIASAIAAWISYRALKDSLEFRKRQLEWNELEKRHEYYKSVVSEPCFETLSSYQSEIRQLLSESHKKARKLHSNNVSVKQLTSHISQTSDTFSSKHLDAREVVGSIIETWMGGDKLRSEIISVFHSLEDGVTQELNLLYTPTENPEFRKIIGNHISKMNKLIIKEDPTYQKEIKDE